MPVPNSQTCCPFPRDRAASRFNAALTQDRYKMSLNVEPGCELAANVICTISLSDTLAARLVHRLKFRSCCAKSDVSISNHYRDLEYGSLSGNRRSLIHRIPPC